MAIVSQKKLFEEAVTALTAYVAVGIVTSANDNEEDPNTYAMCSEIVKMHAKELFSAVSEKLPEVVKHLAALPPKSFE